MDCDRKANVRNVNQDYLVKIADLSEETIERLFNRYRLELMHFFDEQKLSTAEALALQLEIEDEQLKEWRENRIKINEIFKFSQV